MSDLVAHQVAEARAFATVALALAEATISAIATDRDDAQAFVESVRAHAYDRLRTAAAQPDMRAFAPRMLALLEAVIAHAAQRFRGAN